MNQGKSDIIAKRKVQSLFRNKQKYTNMIIICKYARSVITRVVAYLTHLNTSYHMMHLYANGIYTRDERHTMNLVSWIETFIFIRGVIIQMKPMK